MKAFRNFPFVQSFVNGSVKPIPLVGLLVLNACSAVPGNGPFAQTIISASANRGEATQPAQQKLVFDVVNVDPHVASLVVAKRAQSFERTFGLGSNAIEPVIGVGDTVDVAIFEVGSDGLFSTKDSKSKTIPVVIQPNGNGQIPYVGSVKLAGLTPDKARKIIVAALQQKAVEPDVLLTISSNASRTISVMGSVNTPKIIPMPLSPLKLTDALAYAGGVQKSAYDTKVTLVRGKHRGAMSLQSLIDDPADNIYLRPGDEVFASYEPKTFTALGSSTAVGNIPFNAASLSLVQASAMAGGSNPTLADPAGYFLFRYEDATVYQHVVGKNRFNELLAQGLRANESGSYPIVYRFNLRDPQSYFIAQRFPIEDKDVLYMSRHPAADLSTFLSLVSSGSLVAYYASVIKF